MVSRSKKRMAAGERECFSTFEVDRALKGDSARGSALEKRCEDASHSKALCAKSMKCARLFREAFRVPTRPRVAFWQSVARFGVGCYRVRCPQRSTSVMGNPLRTADTTTRWRTSLRFQRDVAAAALAINAHQNFFVRL